MLLVSNEGERLAALSPEKRLEFVKKCEVYIGALKKEGKLIAAQPLMRAVLSRERLQPGATNLSTRKKKYRWAIITSWRPTWMRRSPSPKEILNLNTPPRPG